MLRGVDLDVAAGTRVALVGPSGAGKTTLLRAIAGLARPSEGELEIGGVAQLAVPAHRRRVAVVFQEPRLLPHLSVCDNVALPLRAAGVGRALRRKEAGARLDEVGLGGFADRRVAGLSGGEQQRVALARALSADPRLLLLDEPLAAVDPNRRRSLRQLICDVQEERRLTTILVTHDREEAAELGQSIALMLEGRIVQHDEPRTLFERPASRAAARFFGISNLLRLPGTDPEATWAIRPEQVVVGSGPLRAAVADCTYRGTSASVELEWEGQRIEALVLPADAPAIGSTVAFELPPASLWRVAGDEEEQVRPGSGPRARHVGRP